MDRRVIFIISNCLWTPSPNSQTRFEQWESSGLSSTIPKTRRDVEEIQRNKVVENHQMSPVWSQAAVASLWRKTGRKWEENERKNSKEAKFKSTFWHFRRFSTHALGFLLLGFKKGKSSYKNNLFSQKIVELT